MTQLSPQQIAALKASIAAKYTYDEVIEGCFVVLDAKNWEEVGAKEHDTALDAEAEMEAIIQDEVKAAMEEME